MLTVKEPRRRNRWAVVTCILAGLAVSCALPASASTVADPDPIFTQARINFQFQLNHRDTGAPNIFFHVSSGTPASVVNMMEQEVIITDQFWSFVRPINHPVEVYLADDSRIADLIAAYEPTLTPQGDAGGWLQDIANRIKKTDGGLFGGGSPAYDRNNHANFMLHVGTPSPDGSGFWTQTPSHEYTHTIQRYLLGSDFGPLYTWEVEGQADYIGANFAGRNSNTAFQSYWAQMLTSIPAPKNGGVWTSIAVESWFKGAANTQARNLGGEVSQINYILGAIAQKYLVAKYKLTGVEHYYADLAGAINACGDGDLATHPQCDGLRHQIFTKNFHMTLESFYKAAANLAASEIKWALKTSLTLSPDLRSYQLTPWSNLHLTVNPDPTVDVPVYAPSYTALNALSQQNPNGSASESPYPPNTPAPNRTCPNNEGGHATLYGGAMTCTNGIWVLDPGQSIGTPSTP